MLKKWKYFYIIDYQKEEYLENFWIYTQDTKNVNYESNNIQEDI